jgi:hypothetical protein
VPETPCSGSSRKGGRALRRPLGWRALRPRRPPRKDPRSAARLAGIQAGMLVLDVGGGLGEPARTLASEFGCAVEVLDLTEDFCPAGAAFTTRTGLRDLVSFRHGSALEIPYPDAGFDAAWTQHSSMNIADKGRLYGEIHRVLRPGGRPALHEILAGPVSPIYLLAPWARPRAQSPSSARRCARTPRGDRLRRANLDRRSGSTSCSATTSARCHATRCATPKSAGSPSSGPSLSALSSALFENHSQQNSLQGPEIVTSSLPRIADDNVSHLGSAAPLARANWARK